MKNEKTTNQPTFRMNPYTHQWEQDSKKKKWQSDWHQGWK